MKTVWFVGSDAEVVHHAAPIVAPLGIRVANAETVRCHAHAGDLCIFFNEYFFRFRDACAELIRRGVLTLYAIDGVLEWRNAWDIAAGPAIMRPALSHKIACIGRSQARILESWGNIGKCEVVGVPRFDHLLGRVPRMRHGDEPFRLLIMTAKAPGFTPDQMAQARRSLCDLRNALATPERASIEPVWRITANLAEEIGVANSLRDTTGADLADVLTTVDAVITTPSTSMLEGMLQGVPVALLDYTNSPHYVPAAWRITARDHLSDVLRELQSPPAAKVLYQQTILHDSLECHTPATPRMVQLVEGMLRRGYECRAKGEALTFPRQILPDTQNGHHLPETQFDLARLYPDHPVFGNMDRANLQIEIGHLRKELETRFAGHRAEIDSLRAEVNTRQARLDEIERHPVLGRLLRITRRLLRARAASR